MVYARLRNVLIYLAFKNVSDLQTRLIMTLITRGRVPLGPADSPRAVVSNGLNEPLFITLRVPAFYPFRLEIAAWIWAVPRFCGSHSYAWCWRSRAPAPSTCSPTSVCQVSELPIWALCTVCGCSPLTTSCSQNTKLTFVSGGVASGDVAGTLPEESSAAAVFRKCRAALNPAMLRIVRARCPS